MATPFNQPVDSTPLTISGLQGLVSNFAAGWKIASYNSPADTFTNGMGIYITGLTKVNGAAWGIFVGPNIGQGYLFNGQPSSAALFAFQAQANVTAGINCTGFTGFRVQPVTLEAGASISNEIGIDITLGNVGNNTNIGININDISGVSPFAIKTGTGTVSFGDIVLTPASTTSRASLRLPHGAAPSAPVNGDMWTTSTGLFVRINGVTVGPLT